MATQVAAAIVGDRMNINVNVSAPKIILPYDSSKSNGFFVLDLGKVHLNGFLNSVNGLSLTLAVTDLSAGIMSSNCTTNCTANSNISMGYLLEPVDAILEFSAISLDRPMNQTNGGHPNSISIPMGNLNSDLYSDLFITLKLNSELKIKLTVNKILDIVHYGRIFISFVWNVSSTCTYYLSDNSRYIIYDKLAEGLHTLNNVLNPTINLFNNDINLSDKSCYRNNINSDNNYRKKKRKYSRNISSTVVSNIFGKLISKISKAAKATNFSAGEVEGDGADGSAAGWNYVFLFFK